MELDSLKEIWNDVGNQPVHPGSNEMITDMLLKASKSPIAKMKRNLLMELVVVAILFIPIAIYYFIAFNSRFSLIAWIYIGLLLLFSVYFYYKNKLLNDMQCAACMVKSNLQKQVIVLERYVRLYLIAGTLMVPALIIWLGFILYNKQPSFAGSFHFLPSKDTVLLHSGLFWLLALFVFSIVFYYLNRCYLYKLYGRHVAKLKAVLEEMEEV